MRSQVSLSNPSRTAAISVLMSTVLSVNVVIAQLPSDSMGTSSSIAGMATQLPVLPTKPTRILDGQLYAPVGPQMPVDSFVESLGSNDAAFQVIVGQGRLLTLKDDIAGKPKKRTKSSSFRNSFSGRSDAEDNEAEDNENDEEREEENEEEGALIAVGDPSIADFRLLPNPRLIRVLGLRPGITDLSITTADDETVSFEVHVTYDLRLLEARLRQLFPGSRLKIAQLREHLIVEGQVRSAAEVTRIIEMLEAYVESVQTETDQQGAVDEFFTGAAFEGSDQERNSQADERNPLPIPSQFQVGGLESASARAPNGRVINLLQVPGIHQILLKVRIAELNRTALREIGADVLGVSPSSGNIVGTRIGGAAVTAAGFANPVSNQGAAALTGLLGTATGELGTSSSAFGIFPSGDFQIILRALRQNGFLRVLAEPNLVTMSGHRASFLAGGEFPVPVPQASGGAGNSVTVDFREFGVRLDFLPYVVQDDRIRLTVIPEVSTIDRTLGTTLVVGGDAVPGLNTRRANTTVELRAGQTLALAGLLQVELDGQTSRIPGLGDLPYLGSLFSNTTHRRVEKELVVLVTPQLVAPIEDGDGLPLPGDSIEDPTDSELYIKNQFEGRTGVRHRSTVDYGWCPTRKIIHYERSHISGPVGFGS